MGTCSKCQSIIVQNETNTAPSSSRKRPFLLTEIINAVDDVYPVENIDEPIIELPGSVSHHYFFFK